MSESMSHEELVDRLLTAAFKCDSGINLFNVNKAIKERKQWRKHLLDRLEAQDKTIEALQEAAAGQEW